MSSEVGENEIDKAAETNANIPDSTVKSDTKEDIEERYNKLRGFAVKLKKKVSDLTEELKSSENERQKVIAERDELQNKISQISDNAKTLQRIQSEYDKAQDESEKQRSENKKLCKNLEMVVAENASLKESLYEERDSLARCKSELERRTKETANLESALKHQQNLAKKAKEEKKAEGLMKQQKEKECEELRSRLRAEIQSHKATRSQLDAARQERTTNSVLSLEVDNYERSVEDLKSRLDEEASKSTVLEKIIEENRTTITELENEVEKLRDNFLAKTNQITVLSDKNEALKAELCEKRDEIARSAQEIRGLTESLEMARLENTRLTRDLEKHESEKVSAREEIKTLNKSHEERTKIFETELARLNDLVSLTNLELDAVRNEFAGYKLRAQSVLRNKQSQSKESGTDGRSVAEIEEELRHTRNHAAQLEEKIACCRDNVDTLTKELNVAKEDRDRTLDNSRELSQKLSTLGQDYTALRDQYRTQTSLMEKQRSELSTKIEDIQKLHKKEKSELEAKYRKEISRLESELQKIVANIAENSQSTNHQNEKHHDIKSEHDSQSRSTEILLQEREDGEGSESVDSYPMGLLNQETSHRHSLVPLDELLNSTDDYTKTRQVNFLPRKVDRHELEVCERRVKHLTILLADTERDVAKLTQLNQLLKEDIRRHQRSVERENIANNFEYMKNVILKFVTLKNGDERSRLIPVLNTILKLSPEETQQLNQLAGVGRGWLPAIPIPGWHNA